MVCCHCCVLCVLVLCVLYVSCAMSVYYVYVFVSMTLSVCSLFVLQCAFLLHCARLLDFFYIHSVIHIKCGYCDR